MRDIRVSLLLLISFVLLFSSFLVLCIWGYRFYNKRDANQLAMAASKQGRQDSLFNLYNSAIGKLEQKLVHTTSAADSLQQNLDGRFKEYYRLKDELTALLQTASSDQDFEAARRKIDELQKNIQALRRTNQDISKENRRLYDIVSQMQQSQQTVTKTVPANTVAENTAAVETSTEEAESPERVEKTPKPTPAKGVAKAIEKPAVYAATDLNLEKISGRNNSDNLELIGSFAIKNNPLITTNDDLMIVVVQPNGKVLQKSAWESGTFQTTEGKKIYSCKMRIENPQGQVKKITFSLNGDKSLSGAYSLQVYHKGWMIGNITKRV